MYNQNRGAFLAQSSALNLRESFPSGAEMSSKDEGRRLQTARAHSRGSLPLSQIPATLETSHYTRQRRQLSVKSPSFLVTPSPLHPPPRARKKLPTDDETAPRRGGRARGRGRVHVRGAKGGPVDGRGGVARAGLRFQAAVRLHAGDPGQPQTRGISPRLVAI